MAHQYDDPLGYDPDSNFDHGWVHVGFIKSFSADRPSVWNLGSSSKFWNCCDCALSDTGTPLDDFESATEAYIQNMTMHNLYLAKLAPSLYTCSRNASVRGPDGPETNNTTKDFLLLAPATGLTETKHHRRASIDDIEDQPSSSVHKYLETAAPHERFSYSSCEGMGKGKRHGQAGLAS